MFRIFISGKSVFIEGQIAARDSPTFVPLFILNSFDPSLSLSLSLLQRGSLLEREERFLRSSSLPEEALSRISYLEMIFTLFIIIFNVINLLLFQCVLKAGISKV